MARHSKGLFLIFTFATSFSLLNALKCHCKGGEFEKCDSKGFCTTDGACVIANQAHISWQGCIASNGSFVGCQSSVQPGLGVATQCSCNGKDLCNDKITHKIDKIKETLKCRCSIGTEDCDSNGICETNGACGNVTQSGISSWQCSNSTKTSGCIQAQNASQCVCVDNDFCNTIASPKEFDKHKKDLQCRCTHGSEAGCQPNGICKTNGVCLNATQSGFTYRACLNATLPTGCVTHENSTQCVCGNEDFCNADEKHKKPEFLKEIKCKCSSGQPNCNKETCTTTGVCTKHTVSGSPTIRECADVPPTVAVTLIGCFKFGPNNQTSCACNDKDFCNK